MHVYDQYSTVSKCYKSSHLEHCYATNIYGVPNKIRFPSPSKWNPSPTQNTDHFPPNFALPHSRSRSPPPLPRFSPILILLSFFPSLFETDRHSIVALPIFNMTAAVVFPNTWIRSMLDWIRRLPRRISESDPTTTRNYFKVPATSENQWKCHILAENSTGIWIRWDKFRIRIRRKGSQSSQNEVFLENLVNKNPFTKKR